MVASRHGKKWTTEEDNCLKELFMKHRSYEQMSRVLNRTWFSCKCRLLRLGILSYDDCGGFDESADFEKFKVPNPYKPSEVFEDLCSMCFNDEKVEEGTANTFSNAELNIITDWLKTRLARVAVKLADGEHCFIKEIELNTVKELLETELQVANSMKKISVKEREKVLKRLC